MSKEKKIKQKRLCLTCLSGPEAKYVAFQVISSKREIRADFSVQLSVNIILFKELKYGEATTIKTFIPLSCD